LFSFRKEKREWNENIETKWDGQAAFFQCLILAE